MEGILASVGNDETLMFWDIAQKKSLITKNIGTQATCLDFSPDGKLCAVGLINGVFLILDSWTEKMNFNSYMEQYKLPTLDVLMCPKEAKASVINIKFSNEGSYLAVSYNNEYKLSEYAVIQEQEDENPLLYQRTEDVRKINP